MEETLMIGGQEWYVWLLSILGILEIIFRLTPSEKDNSILNKIKGFIDQFLPNNAKDENEEEDLGDALKKGVNNFLSSKNNHK